MVWKQSDLYIENDCWKNKKRHCYVICIREKKRAPQLLPPPQPYAHELSQRPKNQTNPKVKFWVAKLVVLSPCLIFSLSLTPHPNPLWFIFSFSIRLLRWLLSIARKEVGGQLKGRRWVGVVAACLGEIQVFQWPSLYTPVAWLVGEGL